MKNLLQIFSLLFISQISFISNGYTQTNVSGGIYSSTTWSLSGSPYLITDTIVVFPGVTLTIEPGVEVRFADNTVLEIREATLVAAGTATDSITFTSDNSSPTPGIWQGIYFDAGSTQYDINFNYCNFHYANNAIWIFDDMRMFIRNSVFSENNSGIGNDLGYMLEFRTVDSCSFFNNTNGIGSYVNNPSGTRVGTGDISNSLFVANLNTGVMVQGVEVRNCIVNMNQTGILSESGSSIIVDCIVNSNTEYGIKTTTGDSVRNCEIKYNGVGIRDLSYGQYSSYSMNVIDSNDIGIRIDPPGSMPILSRIYCNRICNNLSYDIYNGTNSAIDASQNYWCGNDSSALTLRIYDGYDDINMGLVTFLPMDMIGCSPLNTSIPENIISTELFLHPNPATDNLNIALSDNMKISSSDLIIYDAFGKEVLRKHFDSNNDSRDLQLDVSKLSKGNYFILFESDNLKLRRMFVKL